MEKQNKNVATNKSITNNSVDISELNFKTIIGDEGISLSITDFDDVINVSIDDNYVEQKAKHCYE